MTKHFALLYHIQRSRPIIEIHILHAIEQTRQSLGKVPLIIRGYVEILYYFFYDVCRWLIIKYLTIFDFQVFDLWLKKFNVFWGMVRVILM